MGEVSTVIGICITKILGGASWITINITFLRFGSESELMFIISDLEYSSLLSGYDVNNGSMEYKNQIKSVTVSVCGKLGELTSHSRNQPFHCSISPW